MRGHRLAALIAAAISLAAMPDPDLTPGVARPLGTAAICRIRWGRDQRHVTAAMKREVFASYGIACRPLFDHGPRCGEWEIDHLISRELGGADDVRNLWPQPYAGEWNARQKDWLENRLHHELCAGRLSLPSAQRQIRRDWPAAYRRYFGE